jgi:hypothetical protein
MLIHWFQYQSLSYVEFVNNVTEKGQPVEKKRKEYWVERNEIIPKKRDGSRMSTYIHISSRVRNLSLTL